MDGMPKHRPHAKKLTTSRLIICVLLLFGDPAFSAVPYTHTQPATLITPTNATLNGMALPNGEPSMAWFEWGARGSYSQATSPIDVGDGTAAVRVSTQVSGLTNRGIYQCRLVVSNAAGLTYGAMQLFTTGRNLTAWGFNNFGQTDLPSGLSNIVAIAGGNSHSLALKGGGMVAAWGYDYFGQTTLPANLSNVVGVAAGGYHSLALKADGAVVGWGLVGSPVGLTNAIAVAGGGYHSLAIKADGTLVAWGENGDGQADVPAGLSNVVAAAGGWSHSLALKADGTVVAWGHGGYGQTSVPVDLSNVVAVAAGFYHSLALKADGMVVAWGLNDHGQASVPQGLSNVVAVTAGFYHSLALKADGMVVAWGPDGGTWPDYGQSVVPSSLSNVVSVAGGGYHSVAIGNLPPQALPQLASAPANRDLVISLYGADSNGDALSFRIVTLPAQGTLYQYAGGVRGPAITSPRSVVSDAGGRVIFAPLTNSVGNPYATFIFVASDGEVESSPATVVVTIERWYAFTQPPTEVRSGSAALNGIVVPNGMPSTAWFEWGARGSYSQTTSPIDVGDGTAAVRVSTQVSGLTNRGIYQCRLVVSNAAGMAYGAVQFFTSGRSVTAWGANEFGQTNVPIGLSNVVAVAGGLYHSLALTTDGKVVAWGQTNYGKVNVPLGLSNVVALAGGAEHSVALKADGRVVAWGYNNYGQTNVPSSLSNVVVIAAGFNHNLALKADGTVAAWGYNGSGQTNVPVGLSNVVAVAGGGGHSLALKADGTVIAWGQNNYGQTNAPEGLSNVVAVACGRSHNLALRADGSVVAWGYNNWGQTDVPLGLNNVVAVAGGYFHSLALQADGMVVAWGYNASGQANVPVGLSDVVAVTAGGYYNLAIGNLPPQAVPQSAWGPANRDLVIGLAGADPNGDALSFRIATLPTQGALYQYAGGVHGAAITSPDTTVSDATGQVIFVPMTNSFGNPYASFTFVASDGEFESSPAPVTIAIIGSPFAFTLGPTEVRPGGATLNGLAVPNGLPTMAWFEWGTNNSYGNLTPITNVGSGDGVVWISAQISGLGVEVAYYGRLVASNSADTTFGHEQVFGVGRRVVAWGDNGAGQATVPAGMSNVVAVAAGSSHSLALQSDGRVTGWGSNDSGQTNVPANLSNVVAIAAGNAHSLALQSDGNVVAWGANNNGQLNVPVGLSNVIAVAAGSAHSMVLRNDGSVLVWGANDNGQTNVPASLSNVVAIAAGTYHCLAIRSDGTVIAWGWNKYGQTNVPPNVTNVIAVAGGFGHNMALRSDGTVTVWGRNTYGQTNVPVNLAGVLAISAGPEYNLALRADGAVMAWGQNTSGQLNVPVSMNQAVAAAAGGSHTLALVVGPDLPLVQTAPLQWISTSTVMLRGCVTPNGTPTVTWFEWGTNGNFGHIIAPTDVGGGTNALLLSAELGGVEANRPYVYRLVASNYWKVVQGHWQVFGLGDKLAAWGANSSWQLRIPSVSNVVTTTGGGSHSLAQLGDGTVVAWGDTCCGQSAVPVGLNSVVSLAAGEYHSLALRCDGTVLAWGNNAYGQTNVPSSLSNAVAMAAGRSHNLAVRTDGTVVGWGYGLAGATSVPASLIDAVTVATGWAQSLALRGNAKLVYWGNDAWGSANIAASLNNVVAIASGWKHCLALRSDGAVIAWGDNYYGQTNVPPGLSNVIAVAAGNYHSLALRSDGSVVAWGNNDSGQTNVPPDLRCVTSLAGGGGHSLAAGPNIAPVVHAQTNIGFPNSDLVIQLVARDPNNDAVTYRVTSLLGEGALYQYAGGVRGPVILVPDTQISDSLGRVIFAPALNALGNPYANFGFVASDGEFDSPQAIVTVNVVLPPAPQLSATESGWGPLPRPVIRTVGLSTPSSNAFALTFDGYSNITYQVWASTNLLDWELVGSAAVASAGQFYFLDLDMTNYPQRFYRISMPAGQVYGLNLSGHSNATYRVWASTNLVDWEVLGAAAVTSNGWFQFFDVDAANLPLRFYRASAP